MNQQDKFTFKIQLILELMAYVGLCNTIILIYVEEVSVYKFNNF